MRVPEDLLPGDVLLYARSNLGGWGWLQGWGLASRHNHVEVVRSKFMGADMPMLAAASRQGRCRLWQIDLADLAVVVRQVPAFSVVAAEDWFHAGRLDRAQGLLATEFAVAFLLAGGAPPDLLWRVRRPDDFLRHPAYAMVWRRA